MGTTAKRRVEDLSNASVFTKTYKGTLTEAYDGHANTIFVRLTGSGGPVPAQVGKNVLPSGLQVGTPVVCFYLRGRLTVLSPGQRIMPIM